MKVTESSTAELRENLSYVGSAPSLPSHGLTNRSSRVFASGEAPISRASTPTSSAAPAVNDSVSIASSGDDSTVADDVSDGYLLPSEIARLVLGYLRSHGAENAHRAFLTESKDLEEYRRVTGFGSSHAEADDDAASLTAGSRKRRRHAPSTTIGGLSLVDMLEDYCALKLQKLAAPETVGKRYRDTWTHLEKLMKMQKFVAGQLKQFAMLDVNKRPLGAKSARVQGARTRSANEELRKRRAKEKMLMSQGKMGAAAVGNIGLVTGVSGPAGMVGNVGVIAGNGMTLGHGIQVLTVSKSPTKVHAVTNQNPSSLSSASDPQGSFIEHPVSVAESTNDAAIVVPHLNTVGAGTWPEPVTQNVGTSAGEEHNLQRAKSQLEPPQMTLLCRRSVGDGSKTSEKDSSLTNCSTLADVISKTIGSPTKIEEECQSTSSKGIARENRKSPKRKSQTPRKGKPPQPLHQQQQSRALKPQPSQQSHHLQRNDGSDAPLASTSTGRPSDEEDSFSAKEFEDWLSKVESSDFPNRIAQIVNQTRMNKEQQQPPQAIPAPNCDAKNPSEAPPIGNPAPSGDDFNQVTDGSSTGGATNNNVDGNSVLDGMIDPNLPITQETLDDLISWMETSEECGSLFGMISNNIIEASTATTSGPTNETKPENAAVTTVDMAEPQLPAVSTVSPGSNTASSEVPNVVVTPFTATTVNSQGNLTASLPQSREPERWVLPPPMPQSTSQQAISVCGTPSKKTATGECYSSITFDFGPLLSSDIRTDASTSVEKSIAPSTAFPSSSLDSARSSTPPSATGLCDDDRALDRKQEARPNRRSVIVRSSSCETVSTIGGAFDSDNMLAKLKGIDISKASSFLLRGDVKKGGKAGKRTKSLSSSLLIKSPNDKESVGIAATTTTSNDATERETSTEVVKLDPGSVGEATSSPRCEQFNAKNISDLENMFDKVKSIDLDRASTLLSKISTKSVKQKNKPKSKNSNVNISKDVDAEKIQSASCVSLTGCLNTEGQNASKDGATEKSPPALGKSQTGCLDTEGQNAELKTESSPRRVNELIRGNSPNASPVETVPLAANDASATEDSTASADESRLSIVLNDAQDVLPSLQNRFAKFKDLDLASVSSKLQQRKGGKKKKNGKDHEGVVKLTSFKENVEKAESTGGVEAASDETLVKIRATPPQTLSDQTHSLPKEEVSEEDSEKTSTASNEKQPRQDENPLFSSDVKPPDILHSDAAQSTSIDRLISERFAKLSGQAFDVDLARKYSSMLKPKKKKKPVPSVSNSFSCATPSKPTSTSATSSAVLVSTMTTTTTSAAVGMGAVTTVTPAATPENKGRGPPTTTPTHAHSTPSLSSATPHPIQSGVVFSAFSPIVADVESPTPSPVHQSAAATAVAPPTTTPPSLHSSGATAECTGAMVDEEPDAAGAMCGEGMSRRAKLFKSPMKRLQQQSSSELLRGPDLCTTRLGATSSSKSDAVLSPDPSSDPATMTKSSFNVQFAAFGSSDISIRRNGAASGGKKKLEDIIFQGTPIASSSSSCSTIEPPSSSESIPSHTRVSSSIASPQRTTQRLEAHDTVDSHRGHCPLPRSFEDKSENNDDNDKSVNNDIVSSISAEFKHGPITTLDKPSIDVKCGPIEEGGTCEKTSNSDLNTKEILSASEGAPNVTGSKKLSKKRKRNSSSTAIDVLNERAIFKRLKKVKDFSKLRDKVDYAFDTENNIRNEGNSSTFVSK